MKLKVFTINSSSESAIEDTVNSWLEGRDFSTIAVQEIKEYSDPRVGVRIYLLYEEVSELVEAE